MDSKLKWGKLVGAAFALSTLSAALVACHGGEQAQVDNTPVQVKLIAMNDFHGNIDKPGNTVVLQDPTKPAGSQAVVGGSAYVATLVNQLKAQNPNSMVVGAGDMVGASPLASALTHDEATIDVLNQIGMEVTSVGNHEFDSGKAELLRKQNGGCFPASADGKLGKVGVDTCLPGSSFTATSGAKFKYLAANVIDTATGQSILPATYTKTFGNVKVGFVGLTLQGTPTAVAATGIQGLQFQAETDVINKYAAQLRASGANAVVVLIHQGGFTTATTINDKTCPGLTGDIVPIVNGLSKDVDVVVSGHTHKEYVCPNMVGKDGNKILLTSAGYYGSVVTDINLTIQPRGGVVSADANSLPVLNGDLTSAEKKAGAKSAYLPAGFTALAADPVVDGMVKNYVGLVAPLINNPVGTISTDIPKSAATLEGPMTDVMADVYLYGYNSVHPTQPADVAFMNPGGVRGSNGLLMTSHTPAGTVTYGDLATMAPFHNVINYTDLTGAQLIRALEQQWENTPPSSCGGATAGCPNQKVLGVSSTLTYSLVAGSTANQPAGQGTRVDVNSVMINGSKLDLTKTYRVVSNSFVIPYPVPANTAPGSCCDNFTAFSALGKNTGTTGMDDLDTFVKYMQAHPGLAAPAPRITNLP